MNIIFVTLGRTTNIHVHGIYSDLMRKFHSEGHNLYIVYPLERKEGKPTSLIEEDGVHYLGVWTFNIQKTNIVEKGIGTILVETQFKKAIDKYFKDIKFDLVLYTTPPITFPNLIGSLKRKNPTAISYLMLKDIFPQNAVDLGMFGKSSLFYKYFRSKEKKLYKNSDYIGCMSPANVDFVINNNPEVNSNRVEICPNSLELINDNHSALDKKAIFTRLGLPTDRPVILYGGNLGKPQGIDFLIKGLSANSKRNDCHFLIVGDGTEYNKIDNWVTSEKPSNVTLIKRLPKQEYDELASCCDVGLICLDHRFTIPNYPSRLLAYLENHMPVIVATDPNSDMGPIAQENGFGYWCESNDVYSFTNCVDKMLTSNIKQMGDAGYNYLCENYLVDNTYNAIIKHFE